MKRICKPHHTTKQCYMRKTMKRYASICWKEKAKLAKLKEKKTTQKPCVVKTTKYTIVMWCTYIFRKIFSETRKTQLKQTKHSKLEQTANREQNKTAKKLCKSIVVIHNTHTHPHKHTHTHNSQQIHTWKREISFFFKQRNPWEAKQKEQNEIPSKIEIKHKKKRCICMQRIRRTGWLL